MLSPMKVAALALALVTAEELIGATSGTREEQKREEVVLSVEGKVEKPVSSATSSQALIATSNNDGENTTPDISGISMRCRYCGAHLAWKHHYQHIPNESKSQAKSTRVESTLGDNGEVLYFDNPAGIEFELATFQESEGVPTDSYTQQDSFFDSYNWRSLSCPRCSKHVGWKFTHVLQEQCISNTESKLNSATQAKKGSRTKLSALVDEAFASQKCHVMANGWWSYEHCYRTEVRQYHEEADGSKPSDWSLGHFTDDMSTDSEVTHHFSGGQHCDENGKLRSTTVKYVCCPEQPDIIVDTIEEPSLCTYNLRVCVPTLCQSKPKNPDAGAAKKVEIACAKTVSLHHKSVLPQFYTLVWPDTIAEDSHELKWAQSLSAITSIIGR